MKTLVIGGTGTVGSLVVKELLKKAEPVRVLTTSASKGAALPLGVEAFIGDLNHPESIVAAFKGVDRVFMLNQHTLTETAQAQNAINAAKEAGISKIVYQSIHRAHEYQEVPHIAAKVLIEKAILESGLTYTFICPNNFFQNDFWFKEAITQYGIYPQPIGDVGLSRIDVRDIAEVAVKALFSPELDGVSVPVAGSEILNGQDTARIFSEQLGLNISYAGNDLVSWAAQTKQYIAEWIVDDWTIMYRLFQQKGIAASAEDLALLTGVLGRAPRSYADFLSDHKPFFQSELTLA
jgi:uncharacterized protein YbjT (DUF2867 family)